VFACAPSWEKIELHLCAVLVVIVNVECHQARAFFHEIVDLVSSASRLIVRHGCEYFIVIQADKQMLNLFMNFVHFGDDAAHHVFFHEGCVVGTWGKGRLQICNVPHGGRQRSVVHGDGGAIHGVRLSFSRSASSGAPNLFRELGLRANYSAEFARARNALVCGSAACQPTRLALMYESMQTDRIMARESACSVIGGFMPQ